MATAKPKDKKWHSFVAGATAGSVEITVLYPAEYAKTQLQLPGSKFKGPVDVIRQTVGADGVRSLYNGLAPMIIGTAAKSAVRFLAYDTYRALLSDRDNKLSKTGLLLAGLMAGMTEAVLVVTPTEMLKTKMIHYQTTGVPKGAVECIATVLRTDGVLGLWQGVVPTMMRQGANSFFRFGTYSQAKELITERYGTSVASHPATTFALGMVAGTITVYGTMPLDVLKTKMQSLSARQYSSSWQCIKSTVKTGGITALWSGATPRLSRLMFSGAIVFTVYEEVMKVLRRLDAS
ncbi:hypothetical protein RI367_001152 [Sorochytrium milnesiophthora]